MTTTEQASGPAPQLEPFRVQPTFAARVWGRESLAPWFDGAATGGERIGEAWLTGPDCPVVGAPGETLAGMARRYPQALGHEGFPLLVKLLFPAEKLSVQVHPDDQEAQALGLARGKTECWYVLDAEPGAEVACGLQQGVTVAEVERAVAEGTLEALLHMVPVERGDMIFVDAGTVHAVGPGMTLLEVQQTCDVTYRLYDYGRPRELHLQDGLRVVKPHTRAGKVAPQPHDSFTRLIEEQYFTVDRLERTPGDELLVLDGPGCVVGLSGSFTLHGVAVHPGQVVIAPAGEYALTCQEPGGVLRAQAPPGV